MIVERKQAPAAREATPAPVDQPSPPPSGTAAERRAIDYAGEEHFHDLWGRSIDPDQVLVVESFEAVTAPENRFIMSWLGDVRGLRVLDLGCGAGEAAVYFARQGANVTAADLSSGMLEVTQAVARRFGVAVDCVQLNADGIDFRDDSFDVVYAANLLHHVELDDCIDALRRVLAPGGRFVSWDPLRHNPVINVYRRMAAAVRTADESPLDIADVGRFRRYFQTVEQRSFWLATLWIFLKFYLVERVHPSQQRYWKKIITDAERLEPTYRRLEALDRLLLRWAPWLQRMCWNIVICCRDPIKTPLDSRPADAGTRDRAAWNVELPGGVQDAPLEQVPPARAPHDAH